MRLINPEPMFGIFFVQYAYEHKISTDQDNVSEHLDRYISVYRILHIETYWRCRLGLGYSDIAALDLHMLVSRFPYSRNIQCVIYSNFTTSK